MISTLIKFMKNKSVSTIGLTAGAIGGVTSILNFDPIQLAVSIMLILCAATLILEKN